MGAHARGASEQVKQLFEVVKAMGSSDVRLLPFHINKQFKAPKIPDKFVAPSEQLREAIGKLVAAQDANDMLSAAKTIHSSTQMLQALAKCVSRDIKCNKNAEMKLEYIRRRLTSWKQECKPLKQLLPK